VKPAPLVLVVPRRLVWALGLLALVVVVWRIQQPPVVVVQRLDAPDGKKRAVLQRTKHVRDHFQIRVSGAGPSYIPYISPPFDHDFRVDLGERLRWSEDSSNVFLRINGKDVWRYTLSSGQSQDLDPTDAW